MKIIAKNEEEKKQILEFSKYMHDYRVYKSKKGVTSISSTENGKDKKHIVKNEELWGFKDGDNHVHNYIAHLYTSPELVEIQMKKRIKYHPESVFATIVFKEGFKPDYIFGNKKQLRDLGIEVTVGERDHLNWDYENPIERISDKEYDVELDWLKEGDGDYCDIIFENGVVFGHVNENNFEILNTEQNKRR